MAPTKNGCHLFFRSIIKIFLLANKSRFMSELLITSIEKHISLTEKEKEQFLALLQVKKVRKKQYFLQEGEVCKHTAFVNKGCLRSYIVDNNGFEHILQFAIKGWWVGEYMSFKTGTPSP